MNQLCIYRSHAVHAGYVDNVPLGLNEVWGRQHGQVVQRPHVGVHDPVKLLQTGVLNVAQLNDTSIVHQDIQSTKLLWNRHYIS